MMESVATKIQSFDDPVRVMVEYDDGDVCYISGCKNVYLKSDLLQFESPEMEKFGHRFKCFLLDEVYRYVIFSEEFGRKEKLVGKKNVPTFHWKK